MYAGAGSLDIGSSDIEPTDLSESEKVHKEKFSTNKLPNYGDLQQINLETEIKKLRDDTVNKDYRKEVGPIIQKIQPTRVENNEPVDLISLRNSEVVSMPPSEPLKQSINGKLVNKEYQKTMNCKFLNSPKCHPDYPNFSGASFSFAGDVKMKCDSLGGNKPANAICTISKGKINGAYVIDGGSGYINEPKITIIGGGGSDAVLKAFIKNGKLDYLKILNGGYGYIETPSIQVEDPNLSNGCYLCCK